MSTKKYSRVAIKKLTEAIQAATDPMVIAELANALAKYLPKPTQPKRRPGTPVTPMKKEPTIDELVAEMEKKRREAGKALNSGSSEIA